MKKRDHWQYFVKAYLVGVDRKGKKTYTNWDLVSSSYDGIVVEIKEWVEWIKTTKHNKTIEISDVYVRLNEDQITDIRHLTGVNNPIKKKNVKKKIITNKI